MTAPYTLHRSPVAGLMVSTQAASSGQVANAQCSAQLTGATATQVNALTQLIVTSSGATAAATTTLQITGLSTQQISGNTMTFMYGVPLGAGVPAAPLALKFEPPLLSKPGTPIKAEMSALGAGHAGVTINLLGKVAPANASS